MLRIVHGKHRQPARFRGKAHSKAQNEHRSIFSFMKPPIYECRSPWKDKRCVPQLSNDNSKAELRLSTRIKPELGSRGPVLSTGGGVLSANARPAKCLLV